MFRTLNVGNFLRGAVSALSPGEPAWTEPTGEASAPTPSSTLGNVLPPSRDTLHPSCFRRLVESVDTVGLFLVDLEGVIVSWNPGAFELTGHSRSEAVGRSLQEFISYEEKIHHTRDDAFWQARLHKTEAWSGERFALHRDGHWSLLTMKVSAIWDANQNIIAYAVSLIAPDALRASQRELQESLTLLRTIIETLPDPLFVKDLNGCYLLVNSAFAQLLGVSQTEVLGRYDEDLWCQEQAELERETDNQVISEVQSRSVEFDRVTLMRGRQFHLHTTKIPFLNASQRVCGVIGILKDFTKTKTIETERETILAQEKTARAHAEKLARMLESIQLINDSAIRHHDAEVILETVLARICSLLPADGAGVYLKRDDKTLLRYAASGIADAPSSCSEVGHGIIGRVAEIGVAESLADKAFGESPHLFADDEKQLHAFIATPLLVEGTCSGVLYVGSTEVAVFSESDVHLLKVIAECLALAIDRWRLFNDLNTANDSLSHLSHRLIEVQEEERRHVARELHDGIGQILTGIKLHLSATQQPLQSEDLREVLATSTQQIDLAISELRRISIGLRPPALDVLGLEAALHEIVDQLPRRAGLQCGVRYSAHRRLPSELEITVFRIAQEALTNIVRHARATEATIVIASSVDEIVMVVSDNGTGFDYENARRQADQGASLGLKSLAERALLLHGRLEVQSVAGEGTQLKVTFPFTTPVA